MFVFTTETQKHRGGRRNFSEDDRRNYVKRHWITRCWTPSQGKLACSQPLTVDPGERITVGSRNASAALLH